MNYFEDFKNKTNILFKTFLDSIKNVSGGRKKKSKNMS